jgi:hypothetical protein
MDELRTAVVNQAAGMVSVQLEVSVDEALFRLRARATVNDRALLDIAKDVVERRIRFDGVADDPNDPLLEEGLQDPPIGSM